MLLLLLKLIIITSILVLGYTIVTQQGMAFYSIRKWANRKQDEGSKWVEPILLCHWCQPSSWTILSFGIAFGLGVINHFEWNLILYYILTVGGSSLVNGLVWQFHLLQDAKTDFYRSAEISADAVADSIYNSTEDEEMEESIFNHQHN